MDSKTLVAVIVTALIVAVLTSLITVKLTGNIVNLPTVYPSPTNYTTLYTKAEVDTLLKSKDVNILNIRDKCYLVNDTLSRAVFAKKISGGYFSTKSEGDKIELYNLTFVYGVNPVGGLNARLLQLSQIGSGTSSTEKTTFQDIITGESFDFTTGVNNVSSRNIDGQTYHVAVTSNFGTGKSANITWGNSAKPGYPGDKKDTFDCW